MNIAGLVSELKSVVESAVSTLRLTGKHGEKPVSVHMWMLPAETAGSIPDAAPYVLIGLREGVDSDEKGTAMVQIDIGTRSGADGVLDVMTVFEKIRLSMLAHPVVGRCYRREGELRWSIPSGEEQPYPYWVAVIVLEFTVPRPVPELEDGAYGQDYKY